ncbi:MULTISPECIES: hypothetical protein [unclassified Streptomyces]|uniref:hypothetical protein n=1 Tax=unclassified Streptomyces TaxID=2593676 RepID=UPI0019D0188E|nr:MULTISPECIES: hypothetical protein [unclassified Streptomyces]
MPETDPSAVRDRLHGTEVFARPVPVFDPERAPAEPSALFPEWLTEAVDAGVPDPHSMTLSTVDEAGDPMPAS